MIKIDYIKEYVTLSETLSFSKTAEQCFITQPALSRHIIMIEEEMGAKLFTRSTRSVALTDAGQAVYESFCGILSEYGRAKERAALLSTGKTGSLTLSIPYYWTEDFIEPLIKRFSVTNPQCETQVVSCQPVEGWNTMLHGQSDITLTARYSKLMDDAIRYVDIATERLCVVLHESDPFAGRTSLRIEELGDREQVFLGQKGLEIANRGLSERLTAHGVHPPKIYYTEQIETLGMTISATGGVSIMPYGVRHMNRSYLRFIPLENEDAFVPMSLCYLKDNNNAFIPQFIREAASGMTKEKSSS